MFCKQTNYPLSCIHCKLRSKCDNKHCINEKNYFIPKLLFHHFICTSNVIKRANKIYCNAFCYYWRSIIISFHSTSNLIPIKSYFLQIVQKFVSCCNKHQMAFNHSLYYLFYQYLITLGFYSSFFHHTSYPLYDFKSFSFYSRLWKCSSSHVSFLKTL